MARGNFLRTLRIGLMVYLLIFVAAAAWFSRARSTSWEHTLWVAVYPINGDGSRAVSDYIDDLEIRMFTDVERFIKSESARYGVTLTEPVRMELKEVITEHPPTPPADRNVAGVMLWSLRLQYWAWRKQSQQSGPNPDIKMFVVYYDPEQHQSLGHSLGLQKGLLGVVNAFASRSMAGSNNVVLTHELLHTLGASDKYNPANGLPVFPDGYAEPELNPRYPQKKAEIMGGRVPVTETEAVTPRTLSRAVVGPLTASEIRWKR